MINFIDKVRRRVRARRQGDITDTASRRDSGSTVDPGDSADPAALLRQSFIP
ncbi:hypothetical protein [Rhodococcus tibetensis]|uniref:Uncharacterized protein n=1 Tax=Rhodococcus tibetensis TaxID=2965064 RepID=A0ABT1Q6F0_9NOCA|nr:hypothetical protein [Rhodococcus sp. FXJ9.536]MCQ4117811.1 hypothetical protein [Rhodococcus sp. FXJ9.536]